MPTNRPARAWAAAALTSMCLLAACDGLLPKDLLGLDRPQQVEPPTATPAPSARMTPRATPKATATPVPRTTPTPRPPTPTPQPTATPEPASPQQAVRGSAVIHIRGIDRLPLKRTLDTIAAATLTWELDGADKRLPIAELDIRGTRARPCLQQPCGDDAGLVVRVSANPSYDGSQRNEALHCGAGVNYHYRLALGPLGRDGGVDVTVQWDEGGFRAATPVDSVYIPAARRPGSFGFGRFLTGSPFAYGQRGFSWDTFSIDRYGGDAALVSWSGQTGRRASCP
jgi:hypothetical protein